MAGTNNQGKDSVNSNKNRQARSGSPANRSRSTTGTKQADMSRSKTTDKPLGNDYTMERKEAARRSLAQEDGSRKSEIMLFVYLAVSIFLFVSNFGLCGFIGNAISGFLFGMLGAVEYIIPIYLFLAAAYLLVNGAHKKVVKRIECVTLFIVALSFVFQLAAGVEDVGIKALFTDGYKEKSGGGVLFGGILVLLYKLVGMPGSIIIIALLVIIGIIVVMDISIVELVKGGLSKRREIMDEPDPDDSYKYRENPNKDINMLGSIEVLDEKKTKKQDKKKEAKNSIVKSEEVHELKPMSEAAADSVRLTADAATPIDYFNIKPNMGHETDASYIDDYDDVEDEAYNPNQHFFEKTELSSNEAFQKPDTNKDSSATASYTELYSEKNSYDEMYGRDTDNAAGYGAGNVDTYKDFIKSNATNIHNSYDVPEGNEVDRDSAFADFTAAEAKSSKEKISAKTAVQNADKTDVEIKNNNEKPEKHKEYRLPPTKLLAPYKAGAGKNNARELEETARLLEMTLANFGVNVTVTEHTSGPAVTRYELQPEMGVKVSKIVGLADDIKLNLAAADIRIEAPIPGKAAVGIEVPNKEKTPVYFRELIESESFQKFPSKIPFAVGKDIGGKVIVADIAKMPHLMVAGSTGSGKSVCINSLIVSILYKAKPDEVKLIMVDPKKVEFSVYNGIPHLMIPVVTDPKKAAGALNWAVNEMTNRYQLFAQYNVRNLQGYNEKVESVTGNKDGNEELKKLPQIVIIIDELADLMMVAHGEVEDAIVRLAQLARAAGIHMVIATQRPSTDVITGLIKANIPSRIAMKVANGVDSRIVLDQVGAEKLLGNGDMMFYPTGYQKPVRVQGAFLSDGEIEGIVDYIKKQQGETEYDKTIEDEITGASTQTATSAGAGEPEVDDYFADAGRFIIGKDKASIGMLQRIYKIGFNRAARIMDQLSDAGVVGPEEGTKPRKVLMTIEEFENYCEEHL